MTRAELLADEATRARKVTQIVDIATALITQSEMSRAEAEALVEYARAAILELFPGSTQTFEVVYAQKFRRLVDECTPPPVPHPPAVVIPFPGPRR
jgi:hypothetical protein